MTFSIPDETFTDYFTVVDEFIDNTFIGQTVTLYSVEIVTQVNDVSHTFNLAGGPNTNYSPDGQLAPFNQKAGGTTFSQVESTTTIRVRWYPDPKEWKKILTVNIPEVKVLIIGYKSDLDKVIRANQIGCEFGGQTQRFSLASQPQRWGFGDRYFVAQLKEA